MKKFVTLFGFMLLFVLFFIGVVEASTFPALPTPDKEYYEYIILNDVDKNRTFLHMWSDTSLIEDLKFFKDGNNIREYSFSNRTLQIFELIDNEWVFVVKNSTTMIDTNISGSVNNIFYSSLDVMSSGGVNATIFFQQTPIPSILTVEMVVAEEAPKMAKRIIQVMKIIVLCGVGCLALLISLPVLLKVFYRFRLK